jgi:predicted metalloprotease with PDZ domain
MKYLLKPFISCAKITPFLLISFCFFLLLSKKAVCHTDSINYVINHSSDSEACLLINFRGTINDSGELPIRFPNGSQDVRISHSGKIKIEKTTDLNVSIFKSVPGENFEISYKICLNHPLKHIDWPIIEENFFSFRPQMALALPTNDEDVELNIDINMESMPNEFKVISSYSQNSKKLKIKESISRFKNTVFVGGKELKVNEFTIKNKPISIISKNMSENISQNSIEYLKKLIKTHRSFWHDNDFPHYLAVFYNIPCSAAHSGFEGRHYQNAFVMQLSDCKDNKSFSREMKWGLSHELFHAWIGFKIKFSESDHPSLLWFLEGFNDYYGLQLAFKSGLMSFGEYLEQYNDILKYYNLLPIKNISNDSIINNFKKDYLYRSLAQLRGHFIAQELSLKLLQKGLSLENLLLTIQSTSPCSKKGFSKNEILSFFNDYIKDDLWKEILEEIEEGKSIKFINSYLEGYAVLTSKEIEVPDFGFNLKALIENQIIKDLEDNSPAYKCGLREGQKVNFHNINVLKTKKIAINTYENGQFKEFSFIPKTRRVQIPQYVPIENVHPVFKYRSHS